MKKAIALFIVLTALLNLKTSGQTWQWAYQAVKGNGNNYAHALTVDPFDNVYISGRNKGTGTYGTGIGGIGLAPIGDRDIYLSKYSESGVFLWAKRYGGIYSDYGYGLSCDSVGNSYLTGHFTTSGSFGVLGSFTTNGASDIYVLKHSPSGVPKWIKYFGGSAGESGYAIKASKTGNVAVGGTISDTVYFDTIRLVSKGLTDVNIFLLDSNGTVKWAKSFGSVGEDVAFGIEQDEFGNVYATGYFTGTVQFGSFTVSSVSAGNSDVFVLKLDPNGNVLWVTTAGSGVADQGLGIDLDRYGNVFVTGNWAQTSIFTRKYSNTGALLWTLNQGSSGFDIGYGVVTDSIGDAYVTGYYSGAMSFGTFPMTCTGADDFFIEKINKDGVVQWVKKSNGPASEHSFAIDINSKNELQVGAAFQGTVNFDGFTYTTTGGTYDAFLGKLIQPVTAAFSFSNDSVCKGQTIQFIDQSIGFPTSYTWSFPGGIPSTSSDKNPLVTYANPGTYNAQLIVSHGPLTKDTLTYTNLINVLYNPVQVLTTDSIICPGDSTVLFTAPQYHDQVWSNGSLSSSIQANLPGIYSVTASDDFGCLTSDSIQINNFNLNNVGLGNNFDVCSIADLPVQLSADSGFVLYQWSSGDTTNSILADSIGQYRVIVTDTNGCINQDSISIGIFPNSAIQLPGDTVLCFSSTYVISADSGYSSYAWSTGENMQTISIVSSNTYVLTVLDSNGCSSSDSIQISFEPSINLIQAVDTLVCIGTMITISCDTGFISYNWSTSENSVSINVDTIGQYYVNATSVNGCIVSDTFNLNNYPTFDFNLGNDTTICDYAVITLSQTGYSTYLWSTSDTTSEITIDTSGIYWLEAIDNNGCVSSDTIQISESTCTGISDEESAFSVNVYPNPASSTVFIQTNQNVNSLEFTLFDSNGKVLLKKAIDKYIIGIEVSNYVSGIYFYVISSDKGTFTGKILVEK